MLDLIQTAFSPVNAVITVLLILNVIYWIVVILGALDVDFLDIELPDSGLEVDSDIDVDVDAEGEVDIALSHHSILCSVLHFFYVGEVPIMLLSSILILSMWTLCMFGNHYFNPRSSFLLAVPIYATSLVASLFICRIFAMPLKKVYDMFNKDYNAPKKVIGRICIVATTSVSDKMGQAEIKTKGAPIVLNVISDGEHVFHKGDEAVVVSRDNEKGIYIIAPLDLEE
ncbi:MAG: DUF1449 family protein [Planctomycetes bacterium]|nr:DUF1449 family protein [Planctomycetota bacterium]